MTRDISLSVGDRVTLKRGHPWEGRSGEVVSVPSSGVVNVQLDGAFEPEVRAFKSEVARV